MYLIIIVYLEIREYFKLFNLKLIPLLTFALVF